MPRSDTTTPGVHPPSLTLHDIVVRVVSVPMRRPLVSNPLIGHLTHWPLLLIDLHTAEGVSGCAYLEPCTLATTRAITEAIGSLAARFKGKPIAPHDLFRAATQSLHMAGREGVTLMAVSGLDMAAWDAFAKAADQPLAVYLGGSLGPLPAYQSSGLFMLTPGELARDAKELLSEGGFQAIKMRLGRPTLAADLDAIRAVRDAIGPDVRLMTDFNQALDIGEALLRLHAMDDLGLQWFEEPIQYDHLDGCAQLARELKTPIQIGENLYGPRPFWRAVQAHAADLYMPDLMRIGGVGGWLRCAAIAGAAGVPLSSHLHPEFSAHLLRVSDTADWLEWRDWAGPIVAEPFELKDGIVHVPDRPGAGLAWNEDAVRRLLV